MYKSPEYLKKQDQIESIKKMIRKQEAWFATSPFKALREDKRNHCLQVCEEQRKVLASLQKDFDSWRKDYEKNPPPDPQQSLF